MPWCPNCRSEYRDGFTNCTECGAPLVAQLPRKKPNVSQRVRQIDDDWKAEQLDGEKKSGDAIWILFLVFGVCLLAALLVLALQ